MIADSQENVEEEVIQVIEKLDEIAQELETYDFYYRIQFALIMKWLAKKISQLYCHYLPNA